jgi:20S proteasome alpha/beta subunit
MNNATNTRSYPGYAPPVRPPAPPFRKATISRYPQPLKQRYPWKKPKEKRMTIAAGFVYRNGVLLCADTEMTGFDMTLHASKMMQFDYPDGKIAAAYAGGGTFATSALQKLKRKLQQVQAGDTLREIEKVLDHEYRRLVLSHPDHTTDGSLGYELLLAICPKQQPAALYVTHQTAIRQEFAYDCIGSGEALAHYLIRPSFGMGMDERRITSLAAFTLAGVKDYVPGCGGLSEFVFIRNDGIMGQFFSKASIGITPRTSTEWLEAHAKEYELISRQLLFALPNPDISDDDFEKNVGLFRDRALDLRRRWRQSNLIHEVNADLTQ